MKLSKKYILIPIFYILVIFFLLFMQFSKAKAFSDSIGILNIDGTNSTGNANQTANISSLKISMNKLVFTFSKENPIYIQLNDGTTINSNIIGYTRFPESLQLNFTNKLNIKILISSGTIDKISIIPSTLSNENNIHSIIIPYEIEEGGEAISIPGLPLLSISFNTRYSFLSLSSGTIETEEKKIILNKTNTLAEMKFETSSFNNPVQYWFSRNSELIDNAEYIKSITNYISKSYTGWKKDRYNINYGTWSTPGLQSIFKEEILTSLLAEAMVRNEYYSVSNMLKYAILKNNDKLTYLSSPFLGRIINKTQLRNKSDREKIEEITELIKNNNINVFKQKDLMSLVINRNFSLAQEIYDLSQRIENIPDDISINLGILKAYLDEMNLESENTINLSRFAGLAEKQILSAILRTEKGLFLETSPGEVKLYDSIFSGYLLIELGKIREDKGITLIGENLIYTALLLSDETGCIPDILLIENNSIIGRKGNLCPEDVYPLITKNPYYPDEYSLNKQIRPGSWIWTAAKISTEISDEINYDNYIEHKFIFSFPKNQTHYIVVHGLEPFTELNVYGKKILPTPLFYQLKFGWFYDQNLKCLFIKLYHYKQEEEISIIYKN